MVQKIDNLEDEQKQDAKPNLVFLQFMNPEICSLYQVEARFTQHFIYREWLRLTKYAILIGKNGLVIPASYLFEVKGIDRFLQDLHSVRAEGLFNFASSTPDLLRYSEEKRKEYRDELLLFPKYADHNESLIENEEKQLSWIPRVKRSASADITRGWRNELTNRNGLWQQIFKTERTGNNRLTDRIEEVIYEIPDQLEGRAFIHRFAKPLLPFMLEPAADVRLQQLISKEYLLSYLEELDAIVLNETIIGDLDCGINNRGLDGKIRTISCRTLSECFESLNVRANLENRASFRDIIKLRTHPVLQWLISLAFNKKLHQFQYLLLKSGYRASEDVRYTKMRPYDLISDRLWRLYATISPLLPLFDTEELIVKNLRLSKRNEKTKNKFKSQLTILQELPEKFDIGIIIALNEEFRVLKKQLGQNLIPYYDQRTRTNYYYFTHPISDGTRQYKCVCTLAGVMGPMKSVLLTERLLARWKVKTIANVGIAGSLSDDVLLGDVIAVSLADNYLERSKAVDASENGFEFEPGGEPFRASQNLIDRCTHYEFANEERYKEFQLSCSNQLDILVQSERSKQLQLNRLLNEKPTLTVGHVACGPTVGASVSFKKWLKSRDRTYLSLDMESGGVLWSVYESIRETESVVLRGISDFSDERKKTLDYIGKGALREYAMHNALQFLWSLMDTGVFQ